MYLSNEDVLKMSNLLKDEMPEVSKELELMATKDDGDVDLINKNHYFASILWQEDDISQLLIKIGKKNNQENINKVLFQGGSFASMNDCSTGWEMLEQIVCEIIDELE